MTQNDVRAIQLAKAALYAGVRLLMDRLGVERVDRVRLAGAFGSHIDVKYAMVLGLVPDCTLEHVTSAGGTRPAPVRGSRCSTGARGPRSSGWCAGSRRWRPPVEPRFQAHFVEAMAIPHKTAAYPELAKAVMLPGAQVARAGGEGEGVRRRRRRARTHRVAGMKVRSAGLSIVCAR